MHLVNPHLNFRLQTPGKPSPNSPNESPAEVPRGAGSPRPPGRQLRPAAGSPRGGRTTTAAQPARTSGAGASRQGSVPPGAHPVPTHRGDAEFGFGSGPVPRRRRRLNLLSRSNARRCRPPRPGPARPPARSVGETRSGTVAGAELSPARQRSAGGGRGRRSSPGVAAAARPLLFNLLHCVSAASRRGAAPAPQRYPASRLAAGPFP